MFYRTSCSQDGPTLNEVFLQEVVDRMGRDLDNYLDDFNSDSLLYPQLMSRSYKDVDYQDNPIPRDQEYLHHSTLWANRYINDVHFDGNLVPIWAMGPPIRSEPRKIQPLKTVDTI
ncbi:unnamed protein product [Nesidiocoris tenuis]|uniref:Uncharacterized protein n=1 Tax=Nesidiocoris tenuis TaxID=355587 RepID=A0A6H5HC06_9HEMI|nr:unnamed protein product [Nesidiocoris tenuis]